MTDALAVGVWAKSKPVIAEAETLGVALRPTEFSTPKVATRVIVSELDEVTSAPTDAVEMLGVSLVDPVMIAPTVAVPMVVVSPVSEVIAAPTVAVPTVVV